VLGDAGDVSAGEVELGDGLLDGDGEADGDGVLPGAMLPMRGRSDGPEVNGGDEAGGLVATNTATAAAAAAATPVVASPTAAGRRAGRSPVFCADSR
jgi:hypothetical protein